jgi:hypothetical protein
MLCEHDKSINLADVEQSDRGRCAAPSAIASLSIMSFHVLPNHVEHARHDHEPQTTCTSSPHHSSLQEAAIAPIEEGRRSLPPNHTSIGTTPESRFPLIGPQLYTSRSSVNTRERR